MNGKGPERWLYQKLMNKWMALTHAQTRSQISQHLQASNALLLMHRRNPRGLANTAWALAKLGHDPGLSWINQFLLASS